MHHNSILYKEPTRCNFGSTVYYSLQDYSTCFGLVQWQLDIYHPDPWHVPVAATTDFSTPDDGRRERPKHVE